MRSDCRKQGLFFTSGYIGMGHSMVLFITPFAAGDLSHCQTIKGQSAGAPLL
jgi:hypothetical protein